MSTLTTVDFDLHGIVGVRLIDASPAEERMITRQLGPIQSRLNRDPDIQIRFVDRLLHESALRLLGVDDAAFNKDAFLVLRGQRKSRVRVQIPFHRIGGHCEIVCQRDLTAVPLLTSIVNLTMLGKGFLPLHASAFSYNDQGVLVTGWAKGGKTETLLAFLSNGASYVGDEWIYLSLDGRLALGIPEPIRIWGWHLEELPVLKNKLSRRDRWKLRSLGLAARSLKKMGRNGDAPPSPGRDLVRRLGHLVNGRLHVHIEPLSAFDSPHRVGFCHPKKLFLVGSHDVSEIIVEPISGSEVAQRMVFSLREEFAGLLSYYNKFRFAFPALSNRLIDQCLAVQPAELAKCFEGLESYRVSHPYPVSFPALFQQMSPYCQ